MNRRGGITRGLVVVALVIVMIGWGVRSLVSRMEEESDARGEHIDAASSSPSSSSSSSSSPSPSPSTSTSTSTASGDPPSSLSPSPAPDTASDDTRPPSLAPTDPAAPHGSLPASAIRDVVRDAVPELRFCFEWQLHQHPELAGRVTMEFTITEDGSVIEPRIVEDALGDDTVAHCFGHVISGLHFPPPDGEGTVLVRYPFTLAGAPEARRPEGI